MDLNDSIRPRCNMRVHCCRNPRYTNSVLKTRRKIDRVAYIRACNKRKRNDVKIYVGQSQDWTLRRHNLIFDICLTSVCLSDIVFRSHLEEDFRRTGIIERVGAT